MATLWERIRALQGRTLLTTRDRVPFDVISVDDDKIKIVVRSRAKTYTINCRNFQKAEELGLVTADVIPDQLNKEGIASGRTAYAAAIIRAIVG